jgi:hypothetical protein
MVGIDLPGSIQRIASVTVPRTSMCNSFLRCKSRRPSWEAIKFRQEFLFFQPTRWLQHPMRVQIPQLEELSTHLDGLVRCKH